ncbi:hypothetical protein [Lederbergia ruris]|uniref:hypothetical protein n=1 Tax=Lederbergia ruris TaxID=217495 RepID=UPI00130DB6B4
MYSYEPFESLGAFTLFRPTFWAILIVTLLLFLGILIPRFRNKMINGFAVLSVSAILVFVSGQLLFYSGIIVDELGLGGDAVSFILFLAIAGLSFVNILVYFLFKVKKGIVVNK